MTLHWEWILLIVTIFFAILPEIFERDQDRGIFKGIAAFLGFWSIIIYIVLGCIWLTNNIKII